VIENVDVAREISDLMIEFLMKLDKSVATVQQNCSLDELHQYRRAVGCILGEMVDRVMNPLYLKHPDLKPDQMR